MVLIDTWWNVNDKHQYMDEEVHSVLIDTWWNVNTIKSARIKSS